MIKRTYIFKKTDKTTSTYSLKIILYFTLFLKISFKEQQSNSVKNF